MQLSCQVFVPVLGSNSRTFSNITSSANAATIFTLDQAMKLLIYSFFNLDARWGEWLTPRPGYFTSGKGTRYTLYRRLGGRQGRSKQVRKILPPPEFDPWTISSRYTDYAIPTHKATAM